MPSNTQRTFDLLTELWNTGKSELAAQVYSDQCERSDPNRTQPFRSAREIANYIAEVHAAFPDFKLEIKRQTGEGDLIATEWTCTGTQKGAYQGIPPTGRRVQVNGVSVNRLANGKIVEERAYFDRLALLQQLGVAPVPEAGQGAANSGA